MNRRETAIKIDSELKNRDMKAAVNLAYYRGTDFSFHCLQTWVFHDTNVDETLEEIRALRKK